MGGKRGADRDAAAHNETMPTHTVIPPGAYAGDFHVLEACLGKPFNVLVLRISNTLATHSLGGACRDRDGKQHVSSTLAARQEHISNTSVGKSIQRSAQKPFFVFCWQQVQQSQSHYI